MSLINKMLTDLEARQQPAVAKDGHDSIYHGLRPAPSARKRSRAVVLSFVVVVSLAVTGLFAWDRWVAEILIADAIEWGEIVRQKVASLAASEMSAARRDDLPVRAYESAPTSRSGTAGAQVPAEAATAPLPTLIPPGARRAAARAGQSPPIPRQEDSKPASLTDKTKAKTKAKSKAKAKAETAANRVSKREAKAETGTTTRRPSPAPARRASTQERLSANKQRLQPAVAPTATQLAMRTQTPLPVPATGSQEPMVVEKSVKSLTADEQAENAYREGARRFEQNRLPDAEGKLRQALQSNPRHVKAREMLAGLVVRMGRWSEAERLLEEGRRLDPEQYQFTRLLARVYVQRGAEDKGLALLEQLQDQAREDAELLGLLAALYQRAGRHREAIKTYSRALILRPEQGQWWLALGISFEAEDNAQAAYRAYLRAVGVRQLNPKLVRYARQRLEFLRAQLTQAPRESPTVAQGDDNAGAN